MVAGKNLTTGLLVVVVAAAFVYLVDPTFFGLLGSRQGFQNPPEMQQDCPPGQKRNSSGQCEPDAGGPEMKPCPPGQVRVGMECQPEGFVNMSSSTSTGEAGPGQMSNPGMVNVGNVTGNEHSLGGNFTLGASPQPVITQGFEDLASMEGPANFGTPGKPAGCYPRDQLTPAELLPKDQNSVWAEQNPMGPGSLKGKNFLSAGALIGVNTVGQSLRNANWQLRSEPPNPQIPVSIFNQSTIQPDVNRRPLEIN